MEIGPGLGALTQPLRQRCGALTVIELDRDLAARLRREPGLTVVEADVLKVDFAALAAAAGQRLRVVGNLPYNISTPILFHLLGAVAHVADQHFMLQKEVVDRMAAAPGSKDYGRLTVMLQWRYRIEPRAGRAARGLRAAAARALGGGAHGAAAGRPRAWTRRAWGRW